MFGTYVFFSEERARSLAHVLLKETRMNEKEIAHIQHMHISRMAAAATITTPTQRGILNFILNTIYAILAFTFTCFFLNFIIIVIIAVPISRVWTNKGRMCE